LDGVYRAGHSLFCVSRNPVLNRVALTTVAIDHGLERRVGEALADGLGAFDCRFQRLGKHHRGVLRVADAAS
ncbi:hypothetical protein ACEQ6A_34930, partial [Rhizobium brockwellii]|uniref:hypothetical protein n=1 Tax=Rhizobium brockwellii TaxID=3019932 RepID=UPI003F97754D